MLLDFALLTTTHLLIFAIGFALVYGLIAWFTRGERNILRRVSAQRRLQASVQQDGPQDRRAQDNPPIYYAGVILVGVVSLIAFFILEDARLKIGLLAAGFLTLLVGIMDENHNLKASTQFIWQIIIAVVAVSWGWTIVHVSNFSGTGVIDLTSYQIGAIVLPGGLLAIGWLLLLMNAMNWLDGVDGLAPGVGAVALLTLAAVTLLPQIQDSQTLSLALLGAGTIIGFLLWNFPPARVYLGTSGSWFLGLFIGLVAIVGGGKIVTTLLVLAIPVVDFLLVAVQRAVAGQAPWHGDTVHHLHHRLLARGFTPRAITIGGIIVSLILGLIAITVQTQQKVIALVIAAAMLIILLVSLISRRTDAV